MSAFLTLPIELLSGVLEHVIRPSQLATLCLVNNAFYSFSAPVLYRRAFIYSWHKDGKLKVVKLFRTLSEHPELAKYVEQLSVKDFPRAIATTEREGIMSLCLRGLQNCINLQAFCWTRDGSLSNSILEALCSLPHLRDLEINGHSDGYYDHRTLLQFTRLRKVTLILPGIKIVNLLPTWAARVSQNLRQLTLVCQSTTLINDKVLEALSVHLTSIEFIYLIGCPKVTHKGLWSIISANEGRLLGLGMEVLSLSFDLSRLAELCQQTKALRSLQSINIHIDVKSASHQWQQHIVDLLASSPLQTFHLTLLAGEPAVDLSDTFCAMIVNSHSNTLRKFSVDRMRLSMDALKDICNRCTSLERLFVVMQHEDLDALGVSLSLAQNLRAFHATRSLGLESEEALVVPEPKILALVRKCSWKLSQIGFYTRVKQVDRVAIRDDDGNIRVEPRLVPYESPEIPEPFLVVRT
ncbi:hypothetical protein BDY19DRAFT_946407 [Irpex rosettiformis]|uniref:Uncharacterized protein n=1 Tax=Irpex rosettiformis TaxID=378272 RepID=A0ACB8U3T2_9APHY|nr:hypothetical protein BDY19DRAFT_946407 [Irpex rosettiformis]